MFWTMSGGATGRQFKTVGVVRLGSLHPNINNVRPNPWRTSGYPAAQHAALPLAESAIRSQATWNVGPKPPQGPQTSPDTLKKRKKERNSLVHPCF